MLSIQILVSILKACHYLLVPFGTSWYILTLGFLLNIKTIYWTEGPRSKSVMRHKQALTGSGFSTSGRVG